MISRCLDLTTASAAWVVLVEPQFLESMWPHEKWGSGLVPCWATQEIANSSPEVMPVTSSPLVSRELANWPEVWQVIALHEWLANADGNSGNYVRLGPGRYAAIDGAEIFGGQDWHGANLGKLGYIHNKLAHLVGAIIDHHPTHSARQRVLAATAAHAGAFYTLEQELLRWLSLLVGSADAHAAAEFLKKRIGLDNTRWQPSTQMQSSD